MSWEKNLHAGELALARGIYHEAERLLLLAKEGAAAFGRGDSAWADVHRSLARVYLAEGKPQQAEECAQEALAGDEGYWGPECDQVADDCFLIGEALRQQWDFERARGWFERAVNYREQRYGTIHDTTLEALGKLLIVYLQAAQTFGIETVHARAYQSFQATHPTGTWATFLRLKEVGDAYARADKLQAFQELLHREAALLRKQVGGTHKEVASVLAVEAEVLKGSARKLAAWSVGTQAQRVEKANDASLFGSTERVYKLPMRMAREAIEQLLMEPIMSLQAPYAVRRARWRIKPTQNADEPLIAQLTYAENPERPERTTELKLTLRTVPRGPMCGATFQWQLFNSSNMALAQAIISYAVKEIDDNISIMKADLALPAGFSNPLAAAPPAGSFSSSAASNWPTPQQFNEAVQNPRTNFADPALQSCEAETNALGLPKPYSGAFATVYKLDQFAVKCFTTEVRDQQQRYAAIASTLRNAQSKYFVPFEYQGDGVAVGAGRYPILKMAWAHGEPLIPYVEANLHSREKMQSLAVKFLRMMMALHQLGVAHGDLQHGNLLIEADEIKLVDYDGMFVPALQGWKSNELGHRNYQHPKRTAELFDARLDNFSAWVIYTSLICLSRAPQLWNILGAGEEALLFKHDDFVSPRDSRTLHLLHGENDPDVKAAIRFFDDIVQRAPEDVPGVAEVFATGQPPSVGAQSNESRE